MRYFVILIGVVFSAASYGQTLVGGAGICKVTGDPDAIASMQIQDQRGDCSFAFDTVNMVLYMYDVTETVGQRWNVFTSGGGIQPSDEPAGDLDGTYANPSVVGFNGRPLSLAAPSSGDGYVWNGVSFVLQQIGLVASTSNTNTISLSLASNNLSADVEIDNTVNSGLVETVNGIKFDPSGIGTFDPTASGLPSGVDNIQEGITANASNNAAQDVLIAQRATQSALIDTSIAIRADFPTPDGNGLFDNNNGSTLGTTSWSLGGNTAITLGTHSYSLTGFNSGVYSSFFGQDQTGRWVINSSNGAGNSSFLELYPEDGIRISSQNKIEIKTPNVNNSTATVGQVLQLSNVSGEVEFATVAGGGGDVTTSQLADTSTVLRNDLTPENKVSADYGVDMPTFGTISDRNILFASVDRFAVTNAGLTNESGTRVNLFDGLSVPAMKITSDTAYIYIDLTPSFGSSGLENPGGKLYVSGGANLDDTSVACWIRLKNSSNNYSNWREATIVTAPNGSGYFEVSTSSLSPVNTFCTEIQIRFINALTANQFLHEIWWAVNELDGRPTERVSKGVRADFSRNGLSVYSGGGSGERDTYLAGNNDNYIVANSGRDLCIGCDDPEYLLDVNGVLRLRPNDTGFSPAVEGTMYWDDSENTLIAYRGSTPWTRNVWRYNNTPSSSSDTGGYTGDIAYDANYLYIKTGSGWRRVALSTF